MSLMELAIGIDLGTTKSCVAIYKHGQVEIITNEQGNRTTPSNVAFTDSGFLTGDAAKSQVSKNPTNSIYGVKRLLGRNIGDQTIREDIKNWPFEVVHDNNNIKIKVKYKGEYKTFFPEQVSSMVLRKMKEVAESYLGMTVHNAAISIPAHFNNSQRQATIIAGNISGFRNIWTINETSAAAIAYGLHKKGGGKGERNVLIFDLGGGTIDVSIITIENSIFEVKATAGSTNLGGTDFDNRLVNHFVQKFERKHNKDLTSNKRAMMRLSTSCERAKRTLSSYNKAGIEIDSLLEGIDFHVTITRARFEELNADLFRSTMEPVEKSLRDAKMNKDQVHEVVLVGGSSRIPKIQELLQDYFNGKELNKSVNPDEAVAHGAAVQAALLLGDKSAELRQLLLIDVTPLSLGIEIDKGTMATAIIRNTAIPAKQSVTFDTVFTKPAGAIVRVFEGESTETKDNNLLGAIHLIGLRSKHKIKYIFDINAFGILDVYAFDKGTKNMAKMTNYSFHFSKDDIERMSKEGQSYFDYKKHQNRSTTAKNKLELFSINLLSKVDNEKHKVSDILKSVLKDKCDETTDWLGCNQLAEEEEYAEKKMELQSMYNQIIIESYKEMAARQQPSQ